MTIRVNCTHEACGQRYKVDEEQLGQAVVCKKCNRPFVVQASNRETVEGATQQSDTASPAPPPVLVEPPPLRSGPATRTPPTPKERAPVKAAREPGVPEQIGRFEVLRWLGAGTFGEVYHARDPVLDREVALKVPHARTLQSETRRARVLTEAKAAAQLRHPNIVPVFEAGKRGDTYYIASAFIEGSTLEDAIDQRRPDFREAAKLVMDLAGALFYAHQRGVVHRDIKPANIMLDAQGDPLVMDFGLARLDAAESKLTHDGTVLGTPAYMSPEQAGGHVDRVGPTSDQYSLGVVLYELLCGSTPFSGPPSLVISLVINQEPDSPRKENPVVPKDLETICLKAMAKNRENRYASCRAMAEDLRRWLAGEPITARRVSPAERLVRWGKRNPAMAALAGTAATLLLIVAIVSMMAYASTARALNRVVQAERDRALAQVESLRRAEIRQVPFLIEAMEASWGETGPRLRELAAQEDLSADERLRISLALVSEDPEQVDYLRDRLLEAEPAELPVIRSALLPHSKRLAEEMWSIVGDPQLPEGRRFRAACALAEFDPQGADWDKTAGPTVEVLVTENPLHVAAWVEALRPVASKLLPPLQAVFEDPDRPESQRAVATGILADYAAREPAVLARLVCTADPKQFATLMPKLQAHGSEAVELLEAQLAKQAAQDATEDAKETLAKRQANAGAALLRMEQTGPVWPLLRHQPDPRLQTWLIHRLSPLGVDPELLAKRLLEEPDASIRQALILSLGQYTPAVRLAGPDRSSSGPPAGLAFLSDTLLELYRDDPDPGIHGAAGWVLRRWGHGEAVEQIERELATGKIEGDRRWLVNKQGQTFVVIPGPVEFLMGSPAGERDRDADEILHRCRIDRTYAIGSTEVTVEQYKRFRPDFGHSQMYRSPEGDCPVLGVSWYEAAEYCNWLSREEGLPEDQWCYVPNAQGHYAEGMELASDWLSRRGYRLPTEAEWEYASRAGTVTSYGFGESRELLGHYGWYVGNSQDRSWPVGSLLPNALGLFDMHGNVWNWCQDWYWGFARSGLRGLRLDDGASAIGAGSYRVIRGGGWSLTAGFCRSASRDWSAPGPRISNLGFRVAFSSVDQSGQSVRQSGKR